MILSIYKRDTFNVVKLTVCIVTCIFLLSKPALQTDRDAFYPNFLRENFYPPQWVQFSLPQNLRPRCDQVIASGEAVPTAEKIV